MFTNNTTNNIISLNDNFTAGKIDFISLTEHIIQTCLEPYGFEIMLPEKDTDADNSSRCTTFNSNLEETENMKSIVLEESNERTPDKGLKSLWTDKRDNMGPKSTGAAPLKCDNFEELDELFGNKPNVTPVAIASSSRGDNKYEGMTNITILEFVFIL